MFNFSSRWSAGNSGSSRFFSFAATVHFPCRLSYIGAIANNRCAMASLEQIIDDFAYLDEWEDRMSYVIELGKALPELSEEQQTPENKVQGCASQVWLVSHSTGEAADPVMTFEGQSDAHIVRGLVAIVLAIYSGKHASEIVKLDALELFGQMRLIEYLTAQRANGLRSMVKRIREEAAATLETAGSASQG